MLDFFVLSNLDFQHARELDETADRLINDMNYMNKLLRNDGNQNEIAEMGESETEHVIQVCHGHICRVQSLSSMRSFSESVP